MRDRHCITHSSRDTVCSFPKKGLTSKAGKEDIIDSATPAATRGGGSVRRSASQEPQPPSPGPALTPWCPGSAWSPCRLPEGPQRLVEVELEHPAVDRLLQPCLPPRALRPPQARARGAPAEPARHCGTPACRPPARCCRCSRLLPPSRVIAARPPRPPCRDASSTVTPLGHARRPGRKRSPPSRLPRPWYGRSSRPRASGRKEPEAPSLPLGPRRSQCAGCNACWELKSTLPWRIHSTVCGWQLRNYGTLETLCVSPYCKILAS